MTGTDLAVGQKRYDTSGVEWTVEYVGENIAVVRNNSSSNIAMWTAGRWEILTTEERII